MTQFDVSIPAMTAAQPPLTAASAALRTFGTSVRSSAQAAAAASGVGPLAGALSSYGAKVGTQADMLATVVDELRKGLVDSVEQYRHDDGSAAAGSNAIDFGAGIPAP